jgi:hypothetical protein
MIFPSFPNALAYYNNNYFNFRGRNNSFKLEIFGNLNPEIDYKLAISETRVANPNLVCNFAGS